MHIHILDEVKRIEILFLIMHFSKKSCCAYASFYEQIKLKKNKEGKAERS